MNDQTATSGARPGSDWDAARYDRISDPQVEWGRRVIARLAPQPHERILDLGCGTGRLTAEIASPRGVLVGLDRSDAMLLVAKSSLSTPAVATGTGRRPACFVRGDGAALPFNGSFDAVFSTATLHWIDDHDAVFRSVFAALGEGGRLVAQCGGGPNLQRLYTRAARLMHVPAYAPFFSGWRDPWHFALPDATTARLRGAGFVDVNVWLESTPATFPTAAAFAEFISCVCVRHHLERLPPDLRGGYAAELTTMAEEDDPAFTLDYWRLNIDARRPRA